MAGPTRVDEKPPRAINLEDAMANKGRLEMPRRIKPGRTGAERKGRSYRVMVRLMAFAHDGKTLQASPNRNGNPAPDGTARSLGASAPQIGRARWRVNPNLSAAPSTPANHRACLDLEFNSLDDQRDRLRSY